MAAHFTIELNGLRFFAAHGLYEEEILTGNEFEVDIAVDHGAPEKIVSSIDQTVNYVELFNIAQQEFGKRNQLLETCAMQIAGRLEKQFPAIEKIKITIRKLNPPITNFTGSVAVTYSKVFK